MDRPLVWFYVRVSANRVSSKFLTSSSIYHSCSRLYFTSIFSVYSIIFSLPHISYLLVDKGLEIHGLLRVAFLSARYTGSSIMEWRPVNVVPVHHVWPLSPPRSLIFYARPPPSSILTLPSILSAAAAAEPSSLARKQPAEFFSSTLSETHHSTSTGSVNKHEGDNYPKGIIFTNH